jgi:adenylosuccinate synthase
VIFEGAQGVLLDEWHGFHPHTTWSTTTLANADQLLVEANYDGSVTRMGLTRAYATRHGAGPFVTEDAILTQMLPDARNGVHTWQQGFRVGWLDLVLLRYALAVAGKIDSLAVTCLDRIDTLPELFVCEQYQREALIIDAIAVNPQKDDLAYQAQITRDLARCQPRLTPIADTNALLAVLETSLNVPVELLSFGADARCKQVVQTIR